MQTICSEAEDCIHEMIFHHIFINRFDANGKWTLITVMETWSGIAGLQTIELKHLKMCEPATYT